MIILARQTKKLTLPSRTIPVKNNVKELKSSGQRTILDLPPKKSASAKAINKAKGK